MLSKELVSVNMKWEYEQQVSSAVSVGEEDTGNRVSQAKSVSAFQFP